MIFFLDIEAEFLRIFSFSSGSIYAVKKPQLLLKNGLFIVLLRWIGQADIWILN